MQILSFVNGPIEPDSSWVSAYGYVVVEDGRVGIAIRFHSGYMSFYPGTSRDDFRRFKYSVSKGKAVWRILIPWHYEEITG